VQLAFRAARQLDARRHGSPNYVEVAQQRGLKTTADETTNSIYFTITLSLETCGRVLIVACANIMTTLHSIALMHLGGLLIPRLDDATV